MRERVLGSGEQDCGIERADLRIPKPGERPHELCVLHEPAESGDLQIACRNSSSALNPVSSVAVGRRF